MADLYPPPPDFAKRSHVPSMEAYRKAYDESVKDPEKFWAKGRGADPMAEELDEGLRLELHRAEDPLVRGGHAQRLRELPRPARGPGSGKTMLAIEKARRLAEEGWRVLLTCYNRPLAEFIRSQLPRPRPAARTRAGVEPQPQLGLFADPEVDVEPFHALASRWARKAGVAPPEPEGPEAERRFFESRLPEALLAATGRIADRYDAIVVDEGQDFFESWWTPPRRCSPIPIAACSRCSTTTTRALHRGRPAADRDPAVPAHHQLPQHARDPRRGAALVPGRGDAGTLTVAGIHTLLWLPRSWQERRKAAA